MNENYIVINGKRLELTKEQLKALGIEVRKNPFERVSDGKMYYFIDVDDGIGYLPDSRDRFDNKTITCVNYFNDEQFAKQVALHQLLYRKLLKYAYDNGYEDTAEWDGTKLHWVIGYDEENSTFVTGWHKIYKMQEVYFSFAYGAKRAIKEVVEPFMKEHPEFVW